MMSVHGDFLFDVFFISLQAEKSGSTSSAAPAGDRGGLPPPPVPVPPLPPVPSPPLRRAGRRSLPGVSGGGTPLPFVVWLARDGQIDGRHWASVGHGGVAAGAPGDGVRSARRRYGGVLAARYAAAPPLMGLFRGLDPGAAAPDGGGCVGGCGLATGDAATAVVDDPCTRRLMEVIGTDLGEDLLTAATEAGDGGTFRCRSLVEGIAVEKFHATICYLRGKP